MDLSDKNELKTAVEKISNLLSIDIGNIDKELEALSINSNELLYDKIDSEKNSSPLFRYLLVCRSYIKQPSLELKYDIFQAAIVIPHIRNLSSAIDKLLSDVKNSRARIESLIYKKTVDELNSTIVES